MGPVRWIRPSGARTGRGGHWVGGPGTAFLPGSPRVGTRLWWVHECGRWEEEAADVGHLFWKFGSKEQRKEVAQAAGSRERFLV